MSVVSKTFAMQNNTGFTLDLASQAPTRLSVVAKSECYIKPVLTGTNLAAPGASPAPAGGSSADYIHMLAGEAVDFDLATGFPHLQQGLTWRGLQGWGVAQGDLLVLGV